MAPKRTAAEPNVQSYRYDETRKNIPPAGLASQGRIAETPRARYSYDPHLPPELRWDSTGDADRLPELLETAKQRKLTDEEAATLADALRNNQPWIEWSGKREQRYFDVDPVTLNIHERVSAQAILKVAARENVQRSLFADPEQEYRDAVQFYRHDVDWANRLILGDSLQVMASLARREDLAGKVQMIYLDPPYGIKFASNFQPEVGRRDVKDKDSDLTREPEMVKAYRDTWTLGVHSYLSYLRDRLVLCRELLADSGSIFVQISDENLHRVRSVMDDVFGTTNIVSQIVFRKTTGKASSGLDSTYDILLWYARDVGRLTYNPIYVERTVEEDYNLRYLELFDGQRRPMYKAEYESGASRPVDSRPYRPNPLTSQTASNSTTFVYHFQARRFSPGHSGWKTNLEGMKRLDRANRLFGAGNTLTFIRYLHDYPYKIMNNIWDDTRSSGFSDPKLYVVQTNVRVIERCLLMTTDPGDLVLDPTCGSGTTAYVAEQWGRRWITIDTSRVALSLARQRILTSTFPMYRVRGESGKPEGPNPGDGFNYKTVPHITLKSIAQNVALDAIFARHQPVLDERLAALNRLVSEVSPELRRRLREKLADKERREGKRSVTDADRRRWLLPAERWEEWEVPFETDPEWPSALQAALREYRAAWRAKMDEVNAEIAAKAEQEQLVDQPETVRGVTRVAGPFTVEAVLPAVESLIAESPIEGEHGDLETFDGASEPANAEAYLDRMLRLLRADGVRFPDNRTLSFERLDPLGGSPALHAEGEWTADGEQRRVAVSFGPEHGPVSAKQVEDALWQASRRGFDDLIFAGFSFDGAAQAAIQADPNPRVRSHLAHIRPDVSMGGLLKETPNAQLFTVFGKPRTLLRRETDGQYVVEMEGVDIYNPVDNTISATRADKVAAWFVDADYDGRTFCITQAFFPDKSAWDKIARALKGVVDEERFAALSGRTSLPFPAGPNRCVAVKVIDPRGNEVLAIHNLEEQLAYREAAR